MTYSLFLYAESPTERSITEAELTDHLTGLEFISRSAGSHTLAAGNQLMDFITFLGCSPSLKRGEVESSISIHSFKQLTAMGGESINTVRYPTCQHPVHAPTLLIRDYPKTTHWQCPVCSTEGKTQDINWRKSAGFSTLFIEVNNIFPKEAVPSDKLLNTLKFYTKNSWLWFYSKSSSGT